MEWFFPSNNYGQETGFHHAGVETFKGNLNFYLAREALQNCIDAQYNKDAPVRVSFATFDLPKNNLPCCDDLLARMDACRKYWSHDRNGRKFFDKAVNLLNEKRIRVLKISDFNTTGVMGEDDERGGGWYSLVKCSGSSSKSGTEGGSFGIGKNAPFAASALRTVLYSTLNVDEQLAFQGVAHLVTHEGLDGKTAQHTGFLGGKHGNSVRDRNTIPKPFGRNELGTDVFIIGYSADGGWEREIVSSILENFWPAVMMNRLEADVQGTKVDAGRLPDLLEEYSAERNFTAHLYYSAAKEPRYTFEEDLDEIGRVSLCLSDGKAAFPKRIAMVRQTGMVIYNKQFRSIVPFVGWLFCDDEHGNMRLRDTEPPRHDKWDPDRPEPKASKRVLETLFGWIRDCISNLSVAKHERTIDIPDLYKWLPDDIEGEEPGTEPEQEQGDKESPDKASFPEKVVSGPLLKRKVFATEPDSQGEDRPEGEVAGQGDDNITGAGGPAGDSNEDEGGVGGPGPDLSIPRSGDSDEAGGDGGLKPRIPIKIRSRIFLSEPATGTYRAVIEPEKGAEVVLKFFAVGDDSIPAQIKVREAWTDDGTKLQLDESGLITNFLFNEGKKTALWLRVQSEDRLSLEVSAHEA